MNEEQLAEFKEDFPLLIEAGFIAIKQLDEVNARRIFDAAQALNPTHSAPQIGIGYIAINKLQVKEATQIFQKILDTEPDNQFAQLFMAICFLLTKGKQEEGLKITHEVMEKTTDPNIKNLGTIALEWYETDLSKKNSPIFAKQSEPLKEKNK